LISSRSWKSECAAHEARHRFAGDAGRLDRWQRRRQLLDHPQKFGPQRGGTAKEYLTLVRVVPEKRPFVAIRKTAQGSLAPFTI
jgi:hypothetical protein